jgi:phosphopantothenoylcysteine decarboxylase/phosphopantothenate--cysteine ligase
VAFFDGIADVARILITSGPTRQYLDPVRYLTNASSGRMGAALAQAALDLRHDVLVVTGPVNIAYDPRAEVCEVLTTEEMLRECVSRFPEFDGAIGAAAPCDYMPRFVAAEKLKKTGAPLHLDLIETPDVIATLGQAKRRDQWVVGFALETEDRRFRALAKLEAKLCDLMVSNGAEAINATENAVELLSPTGELLAEIAGSKELVAAELLAQIHRRLILDRPLDGRAVE